MTIHAATSGRGVTCTRCGSGNRAEDRFCESCGTALTPAGEGREPSPPWLNPQGAADTGPVKTADTADATTRYLCAAAHLDPAFARKVIGEYLIESVRAVPPSPGVDSAAVLRDAVAARCRGKIRDGLLLAMLIFSLFTVTGLTIAWLAVAIAVASMAPSTTGPRRRVGVVVGIVVGLALLYLLLPLLARSGLAPVTLLFQGLSGTYLLLAMGIAMVIFGVLLGDEMIVDRLTRERFRRGSFRSDASRTSGWERTVRMLGLAAFARELDRVAHAAASAGGDGRAEVVVHRGWVPFVGSGKLVADQTISLPLERADEDHAPRPFSVAELNGAVQEAMRDLRRSASLSPGRRLARLEIHEQVFVPAQQLTQLGRTPLAEVLTSPHAAPAGSIPVRQARALMDDPIEAGRYYLCFRVESWDRDLVTSCFLTTATDQRTLYLEWSNCVLLPLKAEYRAIDRPAELTTGLRALTAAFVLPTTLFARVANLFHFYRRIPQRPGEIVVDRYGALHSLREFAAAGGSYNFFQDADSLRYAQLVEQALFRAVTQFLEARGYSITNVMEMARSRIAGNITINGGTFTNSAVGIGHNQQRTGATPPPSNRPTSPSGGRSDR